jgi:predicted O-methyltransferase YrrM
VTENQMAHLLAAVKDTEEGAIAEIGSYRGETTRCLAQATNRAVFAVDPYIGYGGAEEEYGRFKLRIAGLRNVTHLKMTSGEAARAWNRGPISLVFIDAVHDYVNARYDISVWSDLVVTGGIIALHDTDDPRFPGSRRAAFEAAKRFHIWAHPPGMVLLRKSADR